MAVNQNATIAPGAGTFSDRVRDAIRHGELRLAFQPQADTHSGRLTGFEALSRWRLDDGTVIPPTSSSPWRKPATPSTSWANGRCAAPAKPPRAGCRTASPTCRWR
nr:EAL domain-containing protein [Azospirillum formosense]